MQHNKWMTKKLPALLLALVMALSALSVCASAVEGKVIFIVRDSKLVGISFSEIIIDLESINYGALEIRDKDGFVWADAVFEKDQPCYVSLGSYNNKGVFSEDPIPLSDTNYTFKLTAKNGKELYENTIAYEFTMQDVIASVTEPMKIKLSEPKISILEQDGDLVTKLSFDFNPDDPAKSVVMPTSFDRTKEINMDVSLYGYAGASFRAVPVSYIDGVMTVALYNGPIPGVAMHGLCVNFNKEDKPLPAYLFTFTIPEDMFRFSDSITSLGAEFTYYQTEIQGIPLVSVIKTSIPKGLLRSIDRTKMNSRAYDMLTISTVVFFTPFFISRLYKGLQKSLGMYGLDVQELMHNSGAFRNIFLGLFGMI